MENDLISRSKALDLVCTKWREHTEPKKQYDMLAKALEEIVLGLKEMPSAQPEDVIRITGRRKFVPEFDFDEDEPEQKVGEWKCSDDMYETGICTYCGWDTEEPWEECKKRYMYCPNCGADMRGE